MLFRRPIRPVPPRPRVEMKPEPTGIRFIDDLPPPPPFSPPPAPKAAATPPPPAPPARRKREWPIGTMAFLAVLGTGLVLRSAGLRVAPALGVEEEIERTFSVSEQPKVVVELFNGPIEVTRGETGKVHSVVTRRTSGADREEAERDLKGISVSMTQVGDTITVRAVRVSGRRNSSDAASARVQVPDGAVVRLTTSNGRVHVEGVEGPVEAHTSNGPVDVKAATGRVSLYSSNGPIHCEASDAVVAAHTTNGPIEFHGLLARGQSTFLTSNGRVSVKLPSRLAFRIDARTSNGKISSDFDVDAERRSSRHALAGTIGHDPKIDLKIRTTNGGVRILEEN
jgi:Putative adhesin